MIYAWFPLHWIDSLVQKVTGKTQNKIETIRKWYKFTFDFDFRGTRNFKETIFGISLN